MKQVFEINVVALIALVSVAIQAGELSDSLAFQLDVRDVGYLNSSNLRFGNALDFEGTASMKGFQNGDAAQNAQVRNEDVAGKTYPWIVRSKPVVYLPQPSVKDDSGNYRASATKLTIADAGAKTAEQTVFVRFKWNGSSIPEKACWCWIGGNGYNWSPARGWMLYLRSKANMTIAYPGIYVGQSSKEIDWDVGSGQTLAVEQDLWYDLFVTLAPSEGKTTARFYLFKTPEKSGSDYELPVPTVGSWSYDGLSFGETADVTIGAENGGAWWTENASQNDGTVKSFRGSLAEFRIYSKSLTQTEMYEAMADTHGSTWEIGVLNGRSDEFNSDNPADVVIPSVTRWSQVRRELDEDHPVLTIKDAMIAREAGMNKILQIEPVAGGGGPLNVEVAVNGKKVVVQNLLESSLVNIPGECWQADADGNVAVTITRAAPFDAKLELDAIFLCGGWKMSGTMTQENRVIAHHFVGQTDSKTMQRSSMPSFPNSIYFHVPEKAIGRYKYEFEVVVENRSAALPPHAFLINDHAFAEFASVDYDSVLSGIIPDVYLKPGQNVLKITSSTGWTTYKSMCIREKFRKGCVVVVR